MKKIDVYDFDKTLYKKDSTIEFYLYALKRNKRIIKHLPVQLMSFLRYKLKLIDKLSFKETFFVFLNDIDDIDNCVLKFWSCNKNYIRFELLKSSKNEKVVISASPYFLLKDICQEIGIDKLIASVVDKKTGKFKGDNCYGAEKLTRLNKEIRDYEIENFYSDSKSDIYLAKNAKNSYLIKKGKTIIWDAKQK